MARSEPSLAPEWLRTVGSASGGVSSNHHAVSSSSHSDSASSLHNTKNKNYRSKGDIDTICSPFLDRSSSTNSRRGHTNGYAKHAYSSFNFSRSNRDKDRWNNDTFPFGSILDGKDHEQLRRSHSMMTKKHSDHLSRGHNISQKIGFDKEFPTLGAEDKHGGINYIKVTYPLICSAVQSLPVSSSASSREGWTSALAEVPTASGPISGSIGGTSSLNMAEALVQGPARTRTPPQGSVKTQRLEELAIKQSRQLIPVISSTPKGSILNPCDKSKTKQQIMNDASKKLLVLKPAVKESANLKNSPKELKRVSQNMTSGQSIEKKPSLSQTRSRIEFFNALKQKRSTKISDDPVNSASVISSSNGEKGKSCKEDMGSDRVGNMRFETADTPDEKEAEFLRSLGWAEDNCQEEALTQEEITAFIEQYKKIKPSLLQKLSMTEETSSQAS